MKKGNLDGIFAKKEETQEGATQEPEQEVTENTEQEEQEKQEETEQEEQEEQQETVDEESTDEAEEQQEDENEEGQEDENEKGQEDETEEDTEQSPTERYDQVAKDLGYENAEAFFNSEALDKIKKFDEISKEYEKTKSENEELYNAYEEVGNPFVNDKVYKVNKLLSENEDMTIEVASNLVDGNVSEMSDLDVLKLKEKVENPDLTNRLINKSLERKYDIEDWDDIDEDASDYINIDAKKARKSLKKYTDIEVPEKIIPENIQEKIKSKEDTAQKSIEEIEKEWEKPLSQFDDAFKQVPIPIPKKDKEGKMSAEVYSNYVLNSDDKAEMRKRVDNIIKQNKLSLTDENLKLINEKVIRDITFERLPKIISIAVDKAVNDYKQSASDRKYNPSKPKGKKVDKTKKGKKSLLDM